MSLLLRKTYFFTQKIFLQIREYFPLERYEANEEGRDEGILSPKLESLFHIIQEAEEGSKIIVFVKTKRTARR